VKTLGTASDGEVVSLDGQVLRHSFDTAFGQSPLCLVRAWASERRLVVGTLAVAATSNEIPAVQALLALLDLRGGVVTADALHCQKETAEAIRAREGDYLLSLKDNQPHLHQDVAALFERLLQAPGPRKDWLGTAPGRAYTTATEPDYGHGRQEQRVCRVLTLASDDPDWADVQQAWSQLRSLVQLRRTRTQNGHTSVETVYYISSVVKDARFIGRAIRRHWQIENGLHYVLDVSLRADACRIRRDHGPQNLALLRSIALNLLRQERRHKAGVRARQKLAGWDPDYLLRLLAQASDTP